MLSSKMPECRGPLIVGRVNFVTLSDAGLQVVPKVHCINVQD